MIQDLTLRWFVTALFVFSAGVCIAAIVRNRHRPEALVSHGLHAIMALAMAVMGWPRGAELPSRAPMVFFAAAAVWFAVVAVRGAGHRVANGYHTLMMLAMAWMYAAMGGLPLPRKSPAATEMAGMDMAGHGGHAGHGAHGGHAAATAPGGGPADWVGALNWVCTLGFAAATVYWLYRFVTARVQPAQGGPSSVGILCQLAMAAGMAIMFGVML